MGTVWGHWRSTAVLESREGRVGVRHQYQGHEGAIVHLSCSSDGFNVVSVRLDGLAKLLDVLAFDLIGSI